MINKKIFILIYYLLILFFKSENIFKETMGAYPPPSGSLRTSRRHCTFFLVCVFNKQKGGDKNERYSVQNLQKFVQYSQARKIL